MPPSRLSTLVIDCQAESMDRAVAFWQAALNVTAAPEAGSRGRYWSLEGGPVDVLLQQVEWPTSYHIDIEADDVDSVRAFHEADPYTQAGLWGRVTLRPFRQVLPRS